VGPSALSKGGTGDHDARVPADVSALVAWGLVLVVLITAAVAIGRLTARLLLRATGSRADRR
jgi:hypothetical protein